MNVLVNFEIAKALKEKGFAKPVNKFYTDTGWLWKQKKQIPTANYNAYPKNPNSKLFYKYGYSAPTIAEVVMWLYEYHNIWISVTMTYPGLFEYTIVKLESTKELAIIHQQVNSPIEAYEAAIIYTLTNLI